MSTDDENWTNYPLNMTGWGRHKTCTYFRTSHFISMIVYNLYSAVTKYNDVLVTTTAIGRAPEICAQIYPEYFNSSTHLCVGGYDSKEMCPVSIRIIFVTISTL